MPKKLPIDKFINFEQKVVNPAFKVIYDKVIFPSFKNVLNIIPIQLHHIFSKAFYDATQYVMSYSATFLLQFNNHTPCNQLSAQHGILQLYIACFNKEVKQVIDSIELLSSLNNNFMESLIKLCDTNQMQHACNIIRDIYSSNNKDNVDNSNEKKEDNNNNNDNNNVTQEELHSMYNINNNTLQEENSVNTQDTLINEQNSNIVETDDQDQNDTASNNNNNVEVSGITLSNIVSDFNNNDVI